MGPCRKHQDKANIKVLTLISLQLCNSKANKAKDNVHLLTGINVVDVKGRDTGPMIVPHLKETIVAVVVAEWQEEEDDKEEE